MTNKRAMVTGCGRRLGFYLTQALLDSGWSVVGQYRTPRTELNTLEEQGAILHQVDFNSVSACEQFAQQLTQYPDVSLVIHNASEFRPEGDGLHPQAKQLESFFYVHMMAPYLINQALRPVLAKQENALIIHITDISTHSPWPKYTGYIATKAGSDSLAKSFAKALAPEIRVNTIAPGPILFLDEHDSAWREQVLAKTPLGREGGLEPIWQSVQFLIDNTYLTGATIHVDGGRSLAEL